MCNGGATMVDMVRLKELRKEKSLTQKQVAELIGVATSTYSMYERGEREPDFATLDKISKLFNASVDYILGNTSQRKYYDLTEKDNKSIEDSLQQLVSELDTGLYSKDMAEYDDESRQLLINALEMGLTVAKREAKKRYTPKKYRNED